MPITYQEPKEHIETIGLILKQIPNHNRCSGKSVFVINKVNKVQGITNEVGDEIYIEQDFLIASSRIDKQWKN